MLFLAHQADKDIGNTPWDDDRPGRIIAAQPLRQVIVAGYVKDDVNRFRQFPVIRAGSNTEFLSFFQRRRICVDIRDSLDMKPSGFDEQFQDRGPANAAADNDHFLQFSSNLSVPIRAMGCTHISSLPQGTILDNFKRIGNNGT